MNSWFLLMSKESFAFFFSQMESSPWWNCCEDCWNDSKGFRILHKLIANQGRTVYSKASAHVCEFYCNKGDVREKAHKKNAPQWLFCCLQASPTAGLIFLVFVVFENFPFRIRKSKCDVNFKIKMYPEGFVLQQAGDSANTKTHVTLGWMSS